MYQVKGTLVGSCDLLFNRMTKRAIDSIDGGKSPGKITREQDIADCDERYYTDPDGRTIIHPWTFKVVVANGAKKGGIKEGRTSFAPYFMATVFVDGFIYIDPDKPTYIHECIGRRPPKTGGACVIRRPAWPTGWTADFTLNVLDDHRNADNIKSSIDEAGLLVGIGSYLPEYGRFTLKNWEVIRNGKG